MSQAEFPATLQRSGALRAIALMLMAVAAFSAMDALLKFFATRYPSMEVAFLRGLCSLPFMALPALVRGQYRELLPGRFWMHLLRGGLMVVMLAGFVYAVRTLSLASAYSIFLAEPLLVTALCGPLLGEWVGWRNWVAIGFWAHRGGGDPATVGLELCDSRRPGCLDCGHGLRTERYGIAGDRAYRLDDGRGDVDGRAHDGDHGCHCRSRLGCR